MTNLRLQLLGSVRARHAGQLVDVGPPRQQAILARWRRIPPGGVPGRPRRRRLGRRSPPAP